MPNHITSTQPAIANTHYALSGGLVAHKGGAPRRTPNGGNRGKEGRPTTTLPGGNWPSTTGNKSGGNRGQGPKR